MDDISIHFPPITGHLKLSQDQTDYLMQPTLKEEVFNAVKSMKPYKALGHDGIQPVFYQKYWSIMGDTIV